MFSYICGKPRIWTALAVKYQSKLCLSRSFVRIFEAAIRKAMI